MKYTSTAVRDGRVWRVQCDQVPGALSIVTRLADAAAHQREAIAFVAQVDEQDVDVDVQPQLPAEVSVHLANAARLRNEAAHAQHEAAVEARAAAGAMAGAGVPLRDVGTILGVSYQRAHQLVSAS